MFIILMDFTPLGWKELHRLEQCAESNEVSFNSVQYPKDEVKLKLSRTG